MTESNTLLVFMSALGIALVTAIFAFFRYVKEQEHPRKTLLNALYAELANILEHYTYSAYEFPTDGESFEIRKKLEWSKYGRLKATSNIDKLGFLNAVSIKSLMQLELRIRNDDAYINQLLEDDCNFTFDRLQIAKLRLQERTQNANGILNLLVFRRPGWKKHLLI